MIIERQTTTASVENEFIFQVKAQDFTVKNFTEGNIFVSDVTPVIKEKAIMIPPQAGQDITMGKTNTANATAVDTLYVLPEATSQIGVEIQAIRW